MAVVQIDIRELSTWLQNRPDNTPNTPYQLEVTGLNPSHFDGYNVLDIIKSYPSKYVDYSYTTIPSGVTNLAMFFYDIKNLIKSPVLPEGLRTLDHAFSYCEGLVEAPVIPSTVTNVEGCFAGCYSMTTAPVLPSGITSLESTFVGCYSITNAPEIPYGITNMVEAFRNCSSLVSVPNIPYTVLYVNGAFAGCSSLTTWKQKNILNLIEYPDFFNGCNSLTNIYSDEPYEIKEWLNTIHTESTDIFPNDPSTLNYYLYSSPDEPSEIPIDNLNNELVTLNANTVSSPFNIKITDLVAGVGDNCYDIRTTLLANPTKYVDLHATVMPDNLITTYDPEVPCGLFEGCTTLVKGVSFSANSQMQNMTGTYKGCSNLKTLPMIPANTSVMNNTFRDCTSLELSATDKIVLNDSQQTIQLTSVFNGCTAITTCAEDLIPETADSIPFFFKNCTALVTAPDIPDGVSDTHNMFEGCTALVTASKVSSSVTNLTETFKGCSALEEIELFEVPMSVLKTNAQDCFSGCTSLTSVKVLGADPIEEADAWHVISLEIDATTVKGKVYDTNGDSVTIPQTTIDKTTLTLPVMSDELWFPTSGTSEQAVEDIIQNILDSRYGYYNKTAIPPDQKSFVMYADDPDNVVSNFLSGGGGSGIKVYNTEDEIIEDLPNLAVGSIVASRTAKDPAVGVPLGTWASFANDSAPNNEWLRAGTTFNENTFPALAMMLGSNVVPEMFDHDRPSEFQTLITRGTTVRPFTAEYDADITIELGSSENRYVTVNGNNYEQTSMTATNSITLSVKKGDIVSCTGSSSITAWAIYGVYYSHPMFIKATPTSSDSDYEGTLNGIRGHISNTVSYSTEEKWTGGYWIDGKKIYRKVVMFNSPISWGANRWELIPNSLTDVPNAEQVTAISTFQHPFTNVTSIDNCCESYADTSGIHLYHLLNITMCGYILEYTKTTEN